MSKNRDRDVKACMEAARLRGLALPVKGERLPEQYYYFLKGWKAALEYAKENPK